MSSWERAISKLISQFRLHGNVWFKPEGKHWLAQFCNSLSDWLIRHFLSLGHCALQSSVEAAKVGGSAVFTCSATSVPAQNFSWTRQGETNRILNDDQHSVSSIEGSSQLTVKNISISDQGFYVCDATVNNNQPCSAGGYIQALCKHGLWLISWGTYVLIISILYNWKYFDNSLMLNSASPILFSHLSHTLLQVLSQATGDACRPGFPRWSPVHNKIYIWDQAGDNNHINSKWTICVCWLCSTRHLWCKVEWKTVLAITVHGTVPGDTCTSDYLNGHM